MRYRSQAKNRAQNRSGRRRNAVIMTPCSIEIGGRELLRRMIDRRDELNAAIRVLQDVVQANARTAID